jgi:hypothetical protein
MHRSEKYRFVFCFVQHWSVRSKFFQDYVSCSFLRHCLGSTVLTNVGEIFSWHALCKSSDMYTLCLTKRVFLTQWPLYERHDKHGIQIQFVACLKSRNIQAGRLALPYSYLLLLGEMIKCTLCIILHPPSCWATSYSLGWNVFLGSLFLNTLSKHSSRNVREWVSHSCQ